jgi:hypothetical protein
MFKERTWVWDWRGLRDVIKPTERTLHRRAWAVFSGRYKFHEGRPSPFFEWAVFQSFKFGLIIVVVAVGVLLEWATPFVRANAWAFLLTGFSIDLIAFAWLVWWRKPANGPVPIAFLTVVAIFGALAVVAINLAIT